LGVRCALFRGTVAVRLHPALSFPNFTRTYTSYTEAPVLEDDTKLSNIIKLPYIRFMESKKGLMPLLSDKALDYHINHHHVHHINQVNLLSQGTEYEGVPLEDIILQTQGQLAHATLFQHASQVWNHNFFWSCVLPYEEEVRKRHPDETLLERFDIHFGSFERFKQKFCSHAHAHMGSGWTWLVDRDGHLEIINTPNTVSIITNNEVSPLLVLDMWEHSYYHDYGPKLEEYTRKFWFVVDWEAVVQNVAGADRRRSHGVNRGLKQIPIAIDSPTL